MPLLRFLFALALTAALAVTAVSAYDAYSRTGAVSASETVAAGYRLWREKGCEGCHTLYGQGGGYAPDLTRIVELRGADYVRAFMVNPAAFHPGQRVMPRFTLKQTEVEQLIALLDAAGTASLTLGWPPRMIQVTGMGGIGGADMAGAGAASTSADPQQARGRVLFSQRCASCHSLEPDVIIVGPSLAGVADRAWYRVPGQSPQQYIRNSVLNPSDYLVEGFADVMQKNLADVLSSDDLDAVIAFLMTLEEPS